MSAKPPRRNATAFKRPAARRQAAKIKAVAKTRDTGDALNSARARGLPRPARKRYPEAPAGKPEARAKATLSPFAAPFRGRNAARKWILVGDSSRVRIFAASAQQGHLAEIAELANPEARANVDELAAYVPPGQGRAMTHQAHATELFSKEVARYLEKARNGKRYDCVYLVAAPEFLGQLRENLSKEVRRTVADQIDKDLSWFNVRDLERYLDKAL